MQISNDNPCRIETYKNNLVMLNGLLRVMGIVQAPFLMYSKCPEGYKPVVRKLPKKVEIVNII